MKKIILLLVILNLNCSNLSDWLDMEMPEIRSIHPANESYGIEIRPEIYVDFSEEMDRPKTESAFSIKSDYGNPRGFFRWEGSRLYYDLAEDLYNSGVYTIRVSAAAEDINGNNIHEQAESRFSVGTDFVKPYIVATVPEDGGTVLDTGSTIEIEFSEPIALTSAEEGFSISPAVAGAKSLRDEGRRLIFTPYDALEYRVYYRVTIGKEITDIAGNPLLEERVITFVVGNDFTPPTLDPAYTEPYNESVGVFSVPLAGGPERLEPFNLNGGIEKDCGIQLVFSEPLNRMGVSLNNNAVTITPAVDYVLNWNGDSSIITINLLSGNTFELEQVYEIRINGSSILDTADNTLDRTYTFPVKINGENSRDIRVGSVQQMECSVQDNTAAVNEEGSSRVLLPDNTLDLDNETGVTPERYSCEVYISGLMEYVSIVRVVFVNNDKDESDFYNSLPLIGIDDIASIKAFSFEFFSWVGIGDPPALVHPVMLNIKIPETRVDALDIYIFSLQKFCNYRMEVKGGNGAEGVKDNKGNYMLEDYKIFLNTGLPE